MTTEAQLERVARSVVRRTEDPPGSNRVFVWDDLIAVNLAAPYFNGQPWCAGYVVWTDLKAKAPILPVQSAYYCPSRVQYARAHQLWDADGRYQPGDEVFFAFTIAGQASGLAEHVGRVLADDGKVITTIEGNTSSGDAGSQDNGGGVYIRKRPHGPTVLGALRYSTLLDKPKPPRRKIRRNPWLAALRNARLPLRFGAKGNAVRAVQWAVGVPVDGDWGAETEHGVRHFQRYHVDRAGHRLNPDGEVGRLTRWALLRITHFEH